jgi:hypothetical protein
MNDELPDDLARALKALDDDASRTAAQRLDPERVAGAVLEQLRREPAAPAPVRRWHGGTLRVAAAAVVLVIGGAIAQRLVVRPVVPADDTAWLSIYTDSIVTAAVQASRVPAESPETTVTVTSAVTMDDLSETELRALLRIMESPEESK